MGAPFTGLGEGLAPPFQGGAARLATDQEKVMDPATALKENLARVEERLLAACARAGRPRESVTLVAVTKTVPPEVAALLPALGVNDLGENRPQELWRKAAVLPAGVRW